MNLSRPWAFLLAGVFATSSAGCATYQAITSTSPAANAGASAERLVSIGRTFENQGRYDQAELMYRKALRSRPNDESIQNQLQQLADRRAGREFSGDSMARAFAMADAVSGGTNRTAKGESQTTRTLKQSHDLQEQTREQLSESAVQLANLANDSTDEAGGVATLSWEDTAPAPPAFDEPHFDEDAQVSAQSLTQPVVVEVQNVQAQGDKTTERAERVTLQQLMDAADDLDANVDLVIAALSSGDSIDTRTLAAALLGDCQTRLDDVATALSTGLQQISDEGVLLAIADSQTQLGIANSDTIDVLLYIAGNNSSAFQVQAVLSLRYFAASPSAEICRTELKSLLKNESEHVRAAAVLTLSDYEESSITLSALQELASEDNDEIVREAARAAIQRIKENPSASGRVSL